MTNFVFKELIYIVIFSAFFAYGARAVWAVSINAEVASVIEEDGFRPGRIAGVSPSMSEVLDDVRHAVPSDAVTFSSRAELALALGAAVAGKAGPILVVVDGKKLRVMELKKNEKGLRSQYHVPWEEVGTKP
ncbi:MAG: hypothetical protein WCI27_01510 [Candidatus Omnitrophota bacterium]